MIAGLANLSVTLIKIVAGVLTGSSAILAEAAHSAADTLNQGFLLTSLKRGSKPADAEHPFGYGQERYFWSLLAAFGIFVAGAGFSVFEGILALGRTANSHDTAGPRGAGVTDLVDLRTMHLGPDRLIVAARVSLDGNIDGDDAENLADRLDRRLAEILPLTPLVFIDPTQRTTY